MKFDSALLYKNDIEIITKFYRDVIGLEVDYRDGGEFMRFKFENDVALGIKKVVEEREVPGHQTIFIASDDIEKYFADIK